MTGIEQAGREQWKTRLGFILAAMGSAVGLGNIWRFSYVLGDNGGAAFLIIYLAMILFIGLPIVLAEFTIGRKAQSDAVGSFQKLAPGKPWVLAGILGVAAAFIVLSFYGVVAGWTMKYLLTYLTGGLSSAPADGYTGFFVGFISNAYEPLLWQFIFMAITIGIVYMGVKKGIEKANKFLMPALALLVILLAIYSLTLGGAREGLSFMFNPDWSVLADPKVYLAALGQAFFSLSLGMGALITYSSYLSAKEKLPSAAASVVSLDTGFAVLCGIMIFPAVFAFNMDPASGAGLVFMVLPEIFAQLGAPWLIGGLFFFLLSAAALTSAVSLLEVAVAYFMRKFNWTRKMTALVIGGIIFLVGVPSSLSNGVFTFTIGERNFMDIMEYIGSDIMLPLGGLIIALFIGWGWRSSESLAAADLGDSTLGRVWIFLLKWIAPIAIFIILLNVIGVLDWLIGLFS